VVVDVVVDVEEDEGSRMVRSSNVLPKTVRRDKSLWRHHGIDLRDNISNESDVLVLLKNPPLVFRVKSVYPQYHERFVVY